MYTYFLSIAKLWLKEFINLMNFMLLIKSLFIKMIIIWFVILINVS